METLKFCPQRGYTVENEPRRKVNQFGDGYQQRIVDGLNPLLRKYALTFNLKPQQAVELDRFFARHGGVTAFQFKDKIRNALVKVVCPKWSQTVKGSHIEIRCDFEEVI